MIVILQNCLFGAVTLTKNGDIEKYKYSGYGIGFYRRSSFSFTGGGSGQNVLIFGADMSTSIHLNNKKKDILVLGRGPMQGLESTLTVGKMYSINFTVTKTKKTGFTGYVYDFSADYNAFTLDDIKDIHKYLMKKNDIV